MAALWEFLSTPANRETLAWIGGALTVAVSGLWVVIKHFTPAAKPGPDTLSPSSVTGGRDIRIGDVALPRLALGLAALGMILLALALVLRPGDTITGSVTTGGDIRDSTINISGPGAPAPTD